MKNLSSLFLPAILAGSISIAEAKQDIFDLTLLHINDHHSHLEADVGANLNFNGISTRVEMGGFPRVTAKIKELSEGKNNILKLHAGDAITGTLFYTLFKGQADADLMNTACFDVFGLGNHEFDEGDANLANFLTLLDSSDNCQTDIVAANVEPALGTPLYPNAEKRLFQPYSINEVNGEKIAVIGIDIASKTKNSSNPDATTEFLDELATVDRYTKKLKQKKVNKIILLTHYQFDNDQQLALLSKGVDIIVGGDSHTLLGDFADLGLNSAGTYPTESTSRNNKKICIVQAWQYSNVVGELNISFDKHGNVLSCQGTPHLLVGDSFKRKDATGSRVELEGDARQAIYDYIDATANISIVEKDLEAELILSGYQGQVDELKADAIGTVSEDLCLVRLPGESRSAICDLSVTNAHGSDISNIVALAFKEQSLEADISIQNAGGVRVDIPAGNISVGDAYTLLPFANTLVNLTMTGQEIITVLEEAVEFSTFTVGGSSGAYPYASGLRWDVDLSQAMGQRFSNIEVKLKGETKWTAIDMTKNYIVVTNNFIAGGKDGYLTFGTVSAEGRVIDTFLDYAQSFVDYVERLTIEGRSIDKLPLDEYSTQLFINKDGQVQN